MTVAAAPFRDGFATGRLDPTCWVPAYLPQWTTPERSAARYRFDGERLVLEITADTEPWCPDHDGDVRVSSIQTGVRSGPVGSPLGQHRFADGLTVVTAQDEQRLFVPHFGRVAIRASAPADPRAMVALWMIGFEDRPEDSGELCVMEIFGRDVAPGRTAVGMGIRALHDPRLVDDFAAVAVDLDVTEPHDYVADWTPAGVTWSIDGSEVRRTRQSPVYGMQLMLGLYAFDAVRPEEAPLRFVVDEVRGDPLDVAGGTRR